jgi:hypothetical protein
MKTFKIAILFLAILNVWHATGQASGSGTGQHNVTVHLPAIALLDVEPGTYTVNLYVDAPSEAGSPATIGSGATDNSLWINYTSAVAPANPDRIISVQISAGVIPAGITLKVQAGAYSGSGAGTLGIPGGTITLSSAPQTIITGIRGAYTGDGPGNGHRLTYSIEINNFGELYAVDEEVLTIAFTITDN